VAIRHLRAASVELRNSARLCFYDFSREHQLGARCPGSRKTAWRTKKPLLDDATECSVANRRIRARNVRDLRRHALVSNAMGCERLHALSKVECRLRH
jgi:hypothetical protein